MTTFYIDPPSGWRYGFPKIIPNDVIGDHTKLCEWLIEEGYPTEDIDLAMKYSRQWSAPDDRN